MGFNLGFKGLSNSDVLV